MTTETANQQNNDVAPINFNITSLESSGIGQNGRQYAKVKVAVNRYGKGDTVERTYMAFDNDKTPNAQQIVEAFESGNLNDHTRYVEFRQSGLPIIKKALSDDQLSALQARRAEREASAGPQA